MYSIYMQNRVWRLRHTRYIIKKRQLIKLFVWKKSIFRDLFVWIISIFADLFVWKISISLSLLLKFSALRISKKKLVLQLNIVQFIMRKAH